MRLIDGDALKEHVMKEGYDQQQFCYPCKAMIWAIDSAPTVKPEDTALHESCTDCPLYDHDRHSCPRFNKIIPTAIQDALSERETAEWFPLEDCSNEGVYCSRCSKKVFKIDFSNTMQKWKNFKYCPNCGARMKNDEM